jgi:biotin carboxyl carrier protein
VKTVWRDGDRIRTVEIAPLAEGRWRVIVDGAELEVAVEPLGRGVFRLLHAGGASMAEVTAVGARRFVRIDRRDYLVEREASTRRRSDSGAQASLESPMPGLVTKVMVAAGDDVRKGQPLVAVEAMKMEHLIRSPRDGRVRRVAAVAGSMVEGGVLLIELDGESGS